MIFNFLCCQPGATLREVVQRKRAIINHRDFRRLFSYRRCCAIAQISFAPSVCGYVAQRKFCFVVADQVLQLVPTTANQRMKEPRRGAFPLPRQSRQAGEAKIICLRRGELLTDLPCSTHALGPPNNHDAAGRSWCPCRPSPPCDPAVLL